MIKGVILDMDGLMADTESSHKLAFRDFLERYGKPFTETDFHRFVGVSVRRNIEVVKEELNLPGSVDDLLAEREEIYLRMIRTAPPEPAPGLKEVIAAARERGLLLAVASGSPLNQIYIVVESILERLGFPGGRNGIFKAVVSADETARPKPAPDVYLLALDRLGLRPEECLSFEDSAPGVMSAAAAGVVCAAVPNRYTRESDFTGASYVLADLIQGVDLIRSLSAGTESRGSGRR